MSQLETTRSLSQFGQGPATLSSSAVDFFLKIEGIPGESQDAKHKGEIDVESWSWGEKMDTHRQGTGLGAGKVDMRPFQFVMKVNKASPKLALACALGDHIKEAILYCRKAGKVPQEYYIVHLSTCLITSYETIAGDGTVVPLDKISMDFSKIEWEYREQKPDGTLAAATKGGAARW
jgi:type VI secretion system secreted protein Hcp